MKNEDLVNGQTIVISNETDGSGEVGRNKVATMKAGDADYTLLTFNSGDLMPMVQNTRTVLPTSASWLSWLLTSS